MVAVYIPRRNNTVSSDYIPMSHFALLWTLSRNEGLSAISRASARRQSAKSRVRRVM